MSKNAIDLLIDDHDTIKKLFKELEATKEEETEKRESLLDTLENLIELHSEMEEQYLYPAFQKAAEDHDDAEMVFEAKEEHEVARLEMPRVKNTEPGTTQFEARVKVLRELLTHHIDEEESDMFPRAKKLLSKEELEEIGAQIEAKRQSSGYPTASK